MILKFISALILPFLFATSIDHPLFKLNQTTGYTFENMNSYCKFTPTEQLPSFKHCKVFVMTDTTVFDAELKNDNAIAKRVYMLFEHVDYWMRKNNFGMKRQTLHVGVDYRDLTILGSSRDSPYPQLTKRLPSPETLLEMLGTQRSPYLHSNFTNAIQETFPRTSENYNEVSLCGALLFTCVPLYEDSWPSRRCITRRIPDHGFSWVQDWCRPDPDVLISLYRRLLVLFGGQAMDDFEMKNQGPCLNSAQGGHYAMDLAYKNWKEPNLCKASPCVQKLISRCLPSAVLGTFYNIFHPDRAKSRCGNGVVDPGEDCDCQNSCEGTLCSPREGYWVNGQMVSQPCKYRQCCQPDCQATAGMVCSGSKSKGHPTCGLAARCQEGSPECPPPAFAPSGLPCDNRGKVCLKGECVNEECSVYGWHTCECRTPTMACYVCCSLKPDGACVPLHRMRRETGLQPVQPLPRPQGSICAKVGVCKGNMCRLPLLPSSQLEEVIPKRETRQEQAADPTCIQTKRWTESALKLSDLDWRVPILLWCGCLLSVIAGLVLWVCYPIRRESEFEKHYLKARQTIAEIGATKKPAPSTAVQKRAASLLALFPNVSPAELLELASQNYSQVDLVIDLFLNKHLLQTFSQMT